MGEGRQASIQPVTRPHKLGEDQNEIGLHQDFENEFFRRICVKTKNKGLCPCLFVFCVFRQNGKYQKEKRLW